MVRGSREIVRLPIAVGVSQNLREDVRGLKLETIVIALLQAEDGGVVGGVPAVVASAGRRIDRIVLRERPQGLSHGRSAIGPQCLESGKTRGDSGGDGGGCSHCGG